MTLLVVTADEKTAEWAREPIRVGLPQWPSLVVCPLVLGPDNVPAIQDPASAGRDVMMAVLSALTHRKEPHAGAILKALAAALGEVDLETAVFLAAFTEVGLGDSEAAQTWRALMTTMTYLYRSQVFSQRLEERRAEGHAEGRVEEAASAVLRVLRARGLAVSEAVASRVRGRTDVGELEALLTRAATVERADDIFDD